MRLRGALGVTTLLAGATTLLALGWLAGPHHDEGRLSQAPSHVCQATQRSFGAPGPMNRRAALDTKMYRDGYPGKEDDPDANLNLRFYMGKLKMPGYPHTIDQIHRKWLGDYDQLEMAHDFIQWLFPIRESSMFNSEAQELQLHEAKAIAQKPECLERMHKSYALMLDFYGMQLVNPQTGEVARHSAFRPCYDNLDSSGHNLLRITRILKCLGEVGLEHYKKPFVLHVLKEIYENEELTSTKGSCLNYWVDLLRNENDRQEVYQYIEQHEKKRCTRTHQPVPQLG